MREYVIFSVFALALFVSTFFVEYERYVLVLATLGSAAWLILKVVTDHQEKKLHEDLGELTEEQYEGFLSDAEAKGLLKRKKEEQD